MHRTLRLTLAASGIAALTACGSATPQARPAPGKSDPPAAATPTKPTKPAATSKPAGRKLVAADLSTLKFFAIDIGVPVVIATSLDAGTEHYLGSRPDGSVQFVGPAVTEATRMRIEPAMVTRRTEQTRNHVVIVSAPVAPGSGPESCVTDTRKLDLRMRACRPGDVTQSWRLQPAGDSGLFELTGAHTAVRVDGGKLIDDDSWSALATKAVR